MAGQRVLFSSYEPSGDALASGTITAMLRERPDLDIHALGGRRMESAGADLLEHTTQHATMLGDTLAQVSRHRARLRTLEAWLREHPIDLLVATDSPAANWSVCKLVRRVQPRAKIAHLVAPQVWAWAQWRIARLRKWSDHVLCILPFEADYFRERGVRATYVGHPIFDPLCHPQTFAAKSLPAGQMKVALLPGSRDGEIRRNWPTMLAAFRQLQQRHTGVTGVVAALDERAEGMIHDITRHVAGEHVWKQGLGMVPACADAVIHWCDVAFAVSGTVTLQVAAAKKPMVVLYNTGWWGYYLVGQWVIATRTYALPNLISEWMGLGRVSEEFVPHFGQEQPLVDALTRLIGSADARRLQAERLGLVTQKLADRQFTPEAAKHLLAML